MFEIKRINGSNVISFDEVPSGALVHRELMSDHYVKIPFTLVSPVYFRIGDYIENDFGRFELTKPYRPKYNPDTSGFDYTLILNAYYLKWENKKCKYLPETTSNEVSFHLTATADVHLSMIVRNVNALGEKDAAFKYHGSPFRFELRNFPESKVGVAKWVQYNSIGIISALNAIASAFECEWWVEGNVIYFGKCLLTGTEVQLTIDDNVSEMTSSESKSEYATRIIAFGSERNLPKNYRADSSADITKDGIVQKRLMLPVTTCPLGYIQDGDVQNETEAVEGIYVDDQIYPRTKCVVSEVIEYEGTVENEDGTTTTQTFYRLKDSSGLNFSTDYILEGETLHILFQSGVMNGMDFECQYNDTEKYYEVVVNEDYGRALPDAALHPAVGDSFVLYGWDSTKIGGTGLIDDAEAELETAARAKLEEMRVDPNTYNCKMYSDWYYDWMKTSNAVVFSLGQPVFLNNIAYFTAGRSSRIIGYELKLDIPFDVPEYIVGEALAYSRTKAMEEQLEAIRVNGVTYAGSGGFIIYNGGSGGGSGGSSGGSGVYLITTTDTTPSSDYNAYSASRTDKDFLRRNKADIAEKQITFKEKSIEEKGVQIGDTFVPGLFGKGGNIDAQAHAEFESLNLRTWLEVPEIRFNRTTVNIGLQMQSVGGGIIEEVHPTSDTEGWFRLKVENGEIGAVDDFDLCMGIWHDENDLEGNEMANSDDRKGKFAFAGFKTVYFQAIDVQGTDRSVVTYTLRPESEGGNGIHPFAGMHFAQRGNTNNAERQAFKYSTTEYTVWLSDVNTWEFQPSNYIEVRGNLEGFALPAIDQYGNQYIKSFHGHGQIFGNAYIFGTIDVFERLMTKLEIDSSMGYVIAWGESTVLTCSVIKGGMEDITNTVTSWEIRRSSGNEAEDNAWLLKTKVKNFDGQIVISFNPEENDLGDGLSTKFTITAKGDADIIASAEVTF